MYSYKRCYAQSPYVLSLCVLAISLALTSGCATIVLSSKQDVSVVGAPKSGGSLDTPSGSFNLSSSGVTNIQLNRSRDNVVATVKCGTSNKRET